MKGLYIEFGIGLDAEKRTLHEIFTNESDWGMFRVIKEGDPSFPIVQEDYKLNRRLYQELQGYPLEYMARQKNTFSFPKLFNPPDTLLEVNTDKRIIIPTQISFGRTFGHVFRKFYFFGTHQEFLDKLTEEGYKLITGAIEKEENKSGMAKTILYVDDDFATREIFQEHFEKKGYVFLAYRDGHSVTEDINQGLEYDIAFVDRSLPFMRLPHINGDDVIRLLKSKHPSKPVVCISAYGTSVDGVDAHLFKPFNAEQLEERIKRFLETKPNPKK